MKRYTIFAIILMMMISACGKPEGETKSPGKRKDERQTVMITELAPRDIDEYVRVSGRLEGITDLMMSSETAGRVLALFKKLGDTVKRGDRIGHVENDVLERRLVSAQAALNTAEINMTMADDNLDYAYAADERQLISQTELKRAESAFRAAQAAYEGAVASAEAARMAYENSYLIAAASGKISQLNVSVGQFIGMGSPVATITDASTLILKSGVGESQIGKIKVGQSATVTHGGKSYPARVRAFGISPMPGTASYPIELELSGSSGLMPGMVVSAQIRTTTYKGLLVTELSNIIRQYDQNYVFVVEGEAEALSAVRRSVELGRTVSQFVEILSGVKAGERIVTSGAENLENGDAVNIRD